MSANLSWLSVEGVSDLKDGVSFTVPWPRGLHSSGQIFDIQGVDGLTSPLDSREIAFWADGSLKWTAHSISGNVPHSPKYTVQSAKDATSKQPEGDGVCIDRASSNLVVGNNCGLRIIFSYPGDASILKSISLNDRVVCCGATIIASINKTEYSTALESIEVENHTSNRAVIKASGVATSSDGIKHLPFDIRFYIYSDAESVKVVHSFIHDLDPQEPLTSLGLRFSVSLEGTEFYNRHVRIGGSNGGILKEEVQGLSGLRHGPTIQNKIDQTSGGIVELKEEEWQRTELAKGLSYIPAWDSYSLSQLSSDGFTIKKRTKEGCSWVKVIGGTRAAGTAFVGSARHGGLAVGMSDFWERFPTELSLSSLTKTEGQMTVWLYSPLAEPLDTSPYHDGLGMDTYAKQLDGLNVTYEDYEPGFATANGIARSNQFFLKLFSATPSNQDLASFSALVRNPPRLVPTSEYTHSTGAFHGCWAPVRKGNVSAKEEEIERNLALLFGFYKGQIEQNRWYGFWDHGDVMHTYDEYRHAWRYDVGGFAWDNSELSTDLWLWLYYLHTGRPDVFKIAEAMTRHTSEVDVYHSGRFRGFGTRHGVQHWSDSSKQLRISNVFYRRIYYFLTGDERTGDLMSELQNCQTALLTLDSHRKVQAKDDVPEGWAMTNIGLDCGPLAASWLTAWERRVPGWEDAKSSIFNLLTGLAALKHGIGNNAILLNPTTAGGEILRACGPPTPEYAISHLSMLFGFPEIFAELLDYATAAAAPPPHGSPEQEVTTRFRDVFLKYCRAYNGGPAVQMREFGFVFPGDGNGNAGWRQSHATLTAYASVQQLGGDDEELGRRAWREFFFETEGEGEGGRRDGIFLEGKRGESGEEEEVVRVLEDGFCEKGKGEEARWLTTNQAARYGVSAIFLLGSVGGLLE